MTARRPADIAAELLDLSAALAEGATFGDLPDGWGGTLALLRDAAAVLDRWPTADEFADARNVQAVARAMARAMGDADSGYLRLNAAHTFQHIAARLARFLDRLDRLDPQPEPQAADDVVTVERSAVEGVLRYLSTENASEPWYVALRAALDARGQR